MEQVIYVDVLVFFNTVITFILLLTTVQFTGTVPKMSRLLIGSFVGGAYSLIIIAPPMNAVLVILTRIAMAITLVSIVFNSKSIKPFIKNFFVFMLCNILYAGAVYAVFYLISPSFLQVNNGYAYYNMSIFSVIAVCGVSYALISILKRTVFNKNVNDCIYKVDFYYGDNKITENALLDTGNGLKDVFNQKPVIILNEKSVLKLTGKNITTENFENLAELNPRLIPVKTLTGKKLLPVFTAEKVIVHKENCEKLSKSPEIVVTDDELGKERYSALLNPEYL